MNTQFPEDLYRHGVLRTLKAWRQRKERYRLLGSKCPRCRSLWWPARRVCGKCQWRRLDEYQCSHTGELFVQHSGRLPWYVPAMQGFGVYAGQRIQAVVRLPEGLYVGPTDVVDCPLEKARDGMKLRKALRKLRREQNGNWEYGYMWVPEEPL